MSNAERCGRVAAALEEFYEEGILADLLTDAMHYAKRHDVDFEIELTLARMHFEDET